MSELLTEEDFIELPEEAVHKWIQLEKVAHSRLLRVIEDATPTDRSIIQQHYMKLVTKLAGKYGVSEIGTPSANSTQAQYEAFRLLVTVAQANIWADSVATFPAGRVAINSATKNTILCLTNEIEAQIDNLQFSDRRRAALHKCLEDFRREINQPKTRVAVALSSLAQATTFVLGVTTSLVVQDVYIRISSLLAAEQIAHLSPEVALLEAERQLLLPPPQKQIEEHSSEQ